MIRWTENAAPGFPYWWEAAPPSDQNDRLPDRVDLLVIGAGYTGLSAALAAESCGARVAVIDAARPGEGASTRNGGMFGAHPRLSWSALAKQFGPDVADALFAEAKPAMQFVRDLIEAEGIDCDFQQTGRIQMAWSEADHAAQKRLAAAVGEKTDVEIRVVPRADLNHEVATERYFGAVLFPEHGGLHPARFHAGLLAAVRRRGIAVVGKCAALSVQREAGFTVQTPRGVIRAEKVVLATNGYTSGAFRWFQRRVFPLPSFLIATEPLPPNLLGHLAPGRRMMVETRARYSYFRVSPDGTRILFGGRASMRPVPLDVAAERLRATMVGIWPELEDARLSHVWSGNTGYSFSHMPSVGEQDGLHYAMGFSGSGTVMAPYLGAKVGYRAMGDPRGETGYAQTGLRPSWLHPTGTPHFLKAADLWYRWAVDRVQTRRGR